MTRLVTDLKNFEKFSTRQLVPGTLERQLVPGTLERPRAGMLANPSMRLVRCVWCMRLVPGTLVSPRRNAGKSGDASGARHLGETPGGNASKRIGGLVGKASELRLQGGFWWTWKLVRIIRP